MFKQNSLAPASLCRHYSELALKTFYPFCQYHGTPDAPNSWKSLKRFTFTWERGNSLPVFNGGSDKTIYGTMSGNIRARAWHDCIHLSNKYSFSYEDEIKTAQEHINQLKLLKAPHNVIATIWADTAGQVEYYYAHKKFLENQLAFVEFLVNNGNDFSLIKEYKED